MFLLSLRSRVICCNKTNIRAICHHLHIRISSKHPFLQPPLLELQKPVCCKLCLQALSVWHPCSHPQPTSGPPAVCSENSAGTSCGPQTDRLFFAASGVRGRSLSPSFLAFDYICLSYFLFSHILTPPPPLPSL